jgi:hypothetical protein
MEAPFHESSVTSKAILGAGISQTPPDAFGNIIDIAAF